MALNLITNPPTELVSSTDWTTLVTKSVAGTIGHGLSIPIFSLTNWDISTDKPEVKAGSIIEVGGSLYQADSDTPLVDDDPIADGEVFIKLVQGTGSPDPTTVIPTITNDPIPAFDPEKGGWYDGGSKFLPFTMIRVSGGTVWNTKGQYVDQNKLIIQYPDGGAYFSGNLGSLTLSTGALTADTVNTGQGNNELYEMNQNVKSTNGVTFAGITCNGDFNPDPSTSEATFSVNAGATKTIGRGLYMFDASSDLQLFVGSQLVGTFAGGAVVSDGVNIKLKNTVSSSARSVKYRKF